MAGMTGGSAMTIGITMPGPADFPAWRQAARSLLAVGTPPDRVEWRLPGDTPGLFAAAPLPDACVAPGATVPRSFLALAEVVIRHRDSQRFALLYRLCLLYPSPSPRD